MGHKGGGYRARMIELAGGIENFNKITTEGQYKTTSEVDSNGKQWFGRIPLSDEEIRAQRKRKKPSPS